MKTTVVICTYNSGDYIIEQLNSVCNQTHSIDEIIIMDDNSTDETVRTIKRHFRNSNISIYINSENLGYVKNFETGLSKASGDIIFFCDHDDKWENNKVETMIAHFKNHPETMLLFSDGKLMDGKSNIVKGSIYKKNNFNNCFRKQFQHRPFEILLRKDVVTGATMAISRKLIAKVVPFPEIYVHDTWLALIAASEGAISFLNKKLITYRLHENQLIGLSSNNMLRKKNNNLLEKLFVLENKLSSLNNEHAVHLVQAKINFTILRNKRSNNLLLKVIQIIKDYKYYRKYTRGTLSILYDIISRRMNK